MGIPTYKHCDRDVGTIETANTKTDYQNIWGNSCDDTTDTDDTTDMDGTTSRAERQQQKRSNMQI